jgi:hypothetical protein
MTKEQTMIYRYHDMSEIGREPFKEHSYMVTVHSKVFFEK